MIRNMNKKIQFLVIVGLQLLCIIGCDVMKEQPSVEEEENGGGGQHGCRLVLDLHDPAGCHGEEEAAGRKSPRRSRNVNGSGKKWVFQVLWKWYPVSETERHNTISRRKLSGQI